MLLSIAAIVAATAALMLVAALTLVALRRLTLHRQHDRREMVDVRAEEPSLSSVLSGHEWTLVLWRCRCGAYWSEALAGNFAAFIKEYHVAGRLMRDIET